MENTKFIEVIDGHFKVEDTGEDYQLETFTHAGVNIVFQVEKDEPNYLQWFAGLVEDFDVDEEILVYLQDEGYRAAFSVRQSLEDFEDFKQWLQDVYDEVTEKEEV